MSFKITYNGLLERIYITTVESEEVAQQMCYGNNKTVPDHWLNIGVGLMSYTEVIP